MQQTSYAPAFSHLSRRERRLCDYPFYLPQAAIGAAETKQAARWVHMNAASYGLRNLGLMMMPLGAMAMTCSFIKNMEIATRATPVWQRTVHWDNLELPEFMGGWGFGITATIAMIGGYVVAKAAEHWLLPALQKSRMAINNRFKERFRENANITGTMSEFLYGKHDIGQTLGNSAFTWALDEYRTARDQTLDFVARTAQKVLKPAKAQPPLSTPLPTPGAVGPQPPAVVAKIKPPELAPVTKPSAPKIVTPPPQPAPPASKPVEVKPAEAEPAEAKRQISRRVKIAGGLVAVLVVGGAVAAATRAVQTRSASQFQPAL